MVASSHRADDCVLCARCATDHRTLKLKFDGCARSSHCVLAGLPRPSLDRTVAARPPDRCKLVPLFCDMLLSCRWAQMSCDLTIRFGIEAGQPFCREQPGCAAYPVAQRGASPLPGRYTRIHTPGASLGGRVSPDECLRDIAHLSAFAPCGYARCGCLRCRVRGSFLSFSAVYGSCAVSQILSLCAPRSAPSALSIFARPRCIIHSTRPLSKCRVVCEHRPPERGRKEGAAGGCRWHCRVRRGTLETVASYSTVSCLSEFPALVSCVYRRSLRPRPVPC